MNPDFNITQLLETNEEGKKLLEVINEILNTPDEEITEANTVAIIRAIKDEIDNEEVRKNAIEELSKYVEQNHFSSIDLSLIGGYIKEAVNKTIDEKDIIEEKKMILHTIAEIFYNIFDELLERMSYSIVLPFKLDEGAKMPTYAHKTDACADIYALENTVVKAHTTSNQIRTGLHCALPENWEIGILPRSSTGSKTPLRLSNSRGVIDEDYRGELIILYDNISNSDYEIKAGDRIAQMFVKPVYRFKGIEVNELKETERGEGGFGSTGK